MLNESQMERLRKQSEEKFPGLTAAQAAEKLYQEAAELRLCNEDGAGDELEEAADVAICLLTFLRLRGITQGAFQRAVEFKIDKTALREFVRRPDGTYQHVGSR